jgi:hypothetical protein
MAIKKPLTGETVTHQHHFEMAFGACRYVMTIALVDDFEEHGFERCP